MKKTLLFAVMMMAVCGVKAQLKVDSLGHVGVGAQPNSTYILNVSNNNDGIKCTAGSPTSYSTSAIEGTVYHKSSGTTYGVQGIGAWSGTQDGISYGLYGCSYGSANGMNYGVYGSVLPMVYGAGIYGASTSYNSLHSINTRYAGYFDGGVYVDGYLTVNGVVTLPSASAHGNHIISTLQNTYRQNDIASLFSKLNPSVYLIDKQPAEYSEKGVSMSILSDSTLQKMPKEIPLTEMEKQVRNKQHYGLDADQLEEVFPDLVYDNEDGSKSINYVEMVPILVQAINELNAKVEQLEGGSAANKPVTRGATNVDGMGENVVVLSLGQNKPNPFGATTSIEVSIPEDVQKAFIYVYDLQGKKVDQVDITARGKQTIQLNAANLSDGMYLYSLIVDGKVVETRRMIMEK